METFQDFLDTIADPTHRQQTSDSLNWVKEHFPELNPEVKWEQPMFTHHGTFIIGFSVSKKHLAVTPEVAGITHFKKAIEASGYDYTKGIIRIPWEQAIDYELLKKMIEFNLHEKAETTSFWRK
ncbi:MAG: iron chaperone [Enterococcus sp.]